MATFEHLKINGVTVPTPALDGVTISHEKIWSSGTGRTSTGSMAGTIIAIKRTLKITWPPLTPDQVKLINRAVNTKTEFFSVEYTTEDGEAGSGTFYAGTPTYTQYSWVNGRRYVTGVSVDLVER